MQPPRQSRGHFAADPAKSSLPSRLPRRKTLQPPDEEFEVADLSQRALVTMKFSNPRRGDAGDDPLQGFSRVAEPLQRQTGAMQRFAALLCAPSGFPGFCDRLAQRRPYLKGGGGCLGNRSDGRELLALVFGEFPFSPLQFPARNSDAAFHGFSEVFAQAREFRVVPEEFVHEGELNVRIAEFIRVMQAVLE